MDTEQVEVLSRGELILERAHEVCQSLEERARKLMQDSGLPACYGRDRAATDAAQRSSVRPDALARSHPAS